MPNFENGTTVEHWLLMLIEENEILENRILALTQERDAALKQMLECKTVIEHLTAH